MFAIFLLCLSVQLSRSIPENKRGTKDFLGKVSLDSLDNCPWVLKNNIDMNFIIKDRKKFKRVAGEIFEEIVRSFDFFSLVLDIFGPIILDTKSKYFSIYYNSLVNQHSYKLHIRRFNSLQKLVASLGLQTRDLVHAFVGINWRKSLFSKKDMFLLMNYAIDIKVNKDCKWKIEQVFNPEKYEKLLDVAKQSKHYWILTYPGEEIRALKRGEKINMRNTRSILIPTKETFDTNSIFSNFLNLNISNISRPSNTSSYIGN
ncbi:putative SP-containing protein [Vairimorpha necatrix]|uniref:SP-containing protein n=1 Tax=Vairimorpha necatrix TaxID=6039 RepID=A0AAX4JF76_9MICR